MSDLLVIWWLVHTYKTFVRSGVGVESQGTLLSSEVWGLLRISSSRNSSKSRALVFPRHHRTLLAFKCPLAQLFSNSFLIRIFVNWSNIALRSICWDASTHRSTLSIETSRDYQKLDLNEYGWWMNWYGFEFVVTWRSGDLSVNEAEVNHNEAKPKRTGGES